MALQSQSPRSQGIRSVSTSGGRPVWPAVAGIAGLFALVAVVVYFWAKGGGPESADASGTGTPLAATDSTSRTPGVQPAPLTTNTTPPVQPTVQPAALGTVAGATTGAPVTTMPDAATIAPQPSAVQPVASASTPIKDGLPAATSNPATTPTRGVTPASAPALPASVLPADLRDQVDAAGRAMATGGPDKLLEARTLLNSVLMDDRTPVSERRAIRGQMQSINGMLIFSPTIAQNDPLVDSYIVEEGDNLTTITRKLSLPVDNRFLLRINGISDPRRLRIGQKLKTVRAPFHVVVHKDEYRLDLYMGPPPSAGGRTTADGADDTWTFIRSFPVGLGESNGTPEGVFVVRPKSKLINPRWVNPRTGEVFEADNPKNPIGEHWIGLDGADANTAKFVGYGIHGTTEPDSIGQSRSMGCVRLLADDVAIVYEVLVDRVSTVRIVK